MTLITATSYFDGWIDLRKFKLLDYAALARLIIAYIDDARAMDDREALNALDRRLKRNEGVLVRRLMVDHALFTILGQLQTTIHESLRSLLRWALVALPFDEEYHRDVGQMPFRTRH
jgi:hypothetical protein